MMLSHASKGIVQIPMKTFDDTKELMKLVQQNEELEEDFRDMKLTRCSMFLTWSSIEWIVGKLREHRVENVLEVGSCIGLLSSYLLAVKQGYDFGRSVLEDGLPEFKSYIVADEKSTCLLPYVSLDAEEATRHFSKRKERKMLILRPTNWKLETQSKPQFHFQKAD